MESNLPNFERAEYVQPTEYNITPDAPRESVDHAMFVKSILFGTGAAIAGCAVYAGFTIVTHIEIGYLALAVGWAIGKAMMTASEDLGGRKYQIAAALLTYVSVSMANQVEFLWLAYRHGQMFHFSFKLLGLLLVFGLASPFMLLKFGVSAFIGLFILAIGIRQAWRMTAGRRSYEA